MNMNKNWMKLPDRNSSEYANGIEVFIGFAKQKLDSKGMTKCPCDKCNNKVDKHITEIRKHLLDHGMDKTYTHWHHHGEEYEVLSDDDYEEDDDDDEVGEPEHITWLHDLLQHWEKRTNAENSELFQSLLVKAQRPSYPGAKEFSMLAFLVNLYNIKIIHRSPDETIDSTLELLRDVLPEGCTLPKSHNEAKTLLGNLYLGLTLLPNDSEAHNDETVKATRAQMDIIMGHFSRSLSK
ncbi:hypothetical protein ACHQM5_002068 [Ranunculus cassubicifolius]